MNRTELLPLLLTFGITASGTAGDQAGGQVHEYVVPSHGKLVLTVPAGLEASSKELSEPPSVLLRFGPRAGDAFYVQVTSVWLDPAKGPKETPESLKATVASTAEEPLQHAVEKTAELKELRGTDTMGFYYSLTDRAPAPGDYKYVSQGVFVTGDLHTAFTILYREAGCPEKETVLRMFAQAKYSK